MGVCAHTCALYEVDAAHYLFISPVCLAAIVCTSACHAIIMLHALFKAQARADSDAESNTGYLSQICLLITLSASQAVVNNYRDPVSRTHFLSYLQVEHSPAQITCFGITCRHEVRHMLLHTPAPHIHTFIIILVFAALLKTQDDKGLLEADIWSLISTSTSWQRCLIGHFSAQSCGFCFQKTKMSSISG